MSIWTFEIQECHLFSPGSLVGLKRLNRPEKNSWFCCTWVIHSNFWFTACWDRNLFFYRQLLIWLSDEKLGLLEGTTKKSACCPSELKSLFESFLFLGCFWVIVNAYWETDSEKKAITDRHFQENSSLASGSPPGVLRFCASFVMQNRSVDWRNSAMETPAFPVLEDTVWWGDRWQCSDSTFTKALLTKVQLWQTRGIVHLN